MDNVCECNNCGDDLIGKEAYCVDCKDNEVNDIKGEVKYDGTDYEKLTNLLIEIGVPFETSEFMSAKSITFEGAVDLNFHKGGAYSDCQKAGD